VTAPPIRREVVHLSVLAAILLLAAVLRFYKLDAQSLWYDEGNSARIAERSVQLIVEGAAGDIHPPLYYLLLKAWRAIFGSGEAGLRAFSAVCGVLTVLFAYLIGRDLFGRRIGLTAAFLLAVAPFAVYYSQEARMYALLALCAAASTFAMLTFGFRAADADRIETKTSTPKLLLYVIATATGLWTHYAYPFVMVAQAVCCLGFWILDVGLAQGPDSPFRTRNPKFPTTYILATLGAVLLYLPWAPIAIRQMLGWNVERQGYVLGPALHDAYRTLVVGRTLPLDQAAPPLAAFGAFMLLGLFLPDRPMPSDTADRSSIRSRLGMLILAALPLALVFAFDLYRDAYLKFLLVCLLPMCVLAGRGINSIVGSIADRRPKIADLAPAILAVTLAVLFAPSLANLYGDPDYARDDYRGIHKRISADARPDDAVIFVAPNQWEVYTYYQGNDRNLFPVRYRPETYNDVARQLEAISAGHERLFVLYFAERDADPEGWYEGWLGANAFKADEEWVGDVRLATYHRPVDGNVLAEVHDAAQFGAAIALEEAKAAFGEAQAGDVIPVELTWRADRAPGTRYAGFIHIGPEDAPPVAQNDGEPVAGYRPTDAWSPGERIIDRRGVWLKPGTPPGTYGIFVGLYDPATGQRVPITRDGRAAGDRLQIGAVTIR
jgi:uncharacterized membrane protein